MALLEDAHTDALRLIFVYGVGLVIIFLDQDNVELSGGGIYDQENQRTIKRPLE